MACRGRVTTLEQMALRIMCRNQQGSEVSAGDETAYLDIQVLCHGSGYRNALAASRPVIIFFIRCFSLNVFILNVQYT